MNYTALEENIKTRLAPLLAEEYEVEIMPETQKGFQKAFQKARVFVGYGGSKYSKPQSTNEVSQEETVTIICYLQTRTREVLNVLVEKLKTLLLGYVPPSGKRMYLVDIDFDKYEENIWYWNVSFAFTKLEVQRFYDGEPDGVPLDPANVSHTTTLH